MCFERSTGIRGLEGLWPQILENRGDNSQNIRNKVVIGEDGLANLVSLLAFVTEVARRPVISSPIFRISSGVGHGDK